MVPIGRNTSRARNSDEGAGCGFIPIAGSRWPSRRRRIRIEIHEHYRDYGLLEHHQGQIEAEVDQSHISLMTISSMPKASKRICSAESRNAPVKAASRWEKPSRKPPPTAPPERGDKPGGRGGATPGPVPLEGRFLRGSLNRRILCTSLARRAPWVEDARGCSMAGL